MLPPFSCPANAEDIDITDFEKKRKKILQFSA